MQAVLAASWLCVLLLPALGSAAPITRRERRQVVTLDAAASIVPEGEGEGEAASAPDSDSAMSTAYVSVEMMRATMYNGENGSSEPEASELIKELKPKKEMTPFMLPRELALFTKYMKEAKNYLEFGSGGSTAFAARMKTIEHIHSVESSNIWIGLLKKQREISAAIKEGRLNLVDTKTGSKKDSQSREGFPTTAKETWPDYSGAAATEGEPEGRYFDTVLIDGRFRVACFLRQVQRDTGANTTYIMHDYEREEYHDVEKHVDVVERAGRLAVFKKRKDLNAKALNATIQEYLYEAM